MDQISVGTFSIFHSWLRTAEREPQWRKAGGRGRGRKQQGGDPRGRERCKCYHRLLFPSPFFLFLLLPFFPLQSLLLSLVQEGFCLQVSNGGPREALLHVPGVWAAVSTVPREVGQPAGSAAPPGRGSPQHCTSQEEGGLWPMWTDLRPPIRWASASLLFPLICYTWNWRSCWCPVEIFTWHHAEINLAIGLVLCSFLFSHLSKVHWFYRWRIPNTDSMPLLDERWNIFSSTTSVQWMGHYQLDIVCIVCMYSNPITKVKATQR